MKILLIDNRSKNVLNFRITIIEYLISLGHEVKIICGDDKEKVKLNSYGFDIEVIKFSNRSISPFKMISLHRRFKKAIKTFEPNIVLTFQVKPNIVGAKAAKKAKVPKVYSFITGLGEPFQPKNFIGRIFKRIYISMYKNSLKNVDGVCFHNSHDRKIFIESKICSEDNAYVVHGNGINTDYFAQSPLPKKDNVLLVTRLVKNKGVYEYIDIARRVKQTHPEISFSLLGPEDEIVLDDIQYAIDEEIINYLGAVDDVRPIIDQHKLCVLTSFREGFPRGLLEPMSMGRPVIGYNTVGVNELVEHGHNGYLVKLHDIDGFAEAIINLLSDPTLVETFANNARIDAVSKYSNKVINEKISNIIFS